MAMIRGKLFDRLRRRWISDLPEERIRQAVITWLLDFGGYPLSLLCSEKQLLHFEEMGSDQSALSPLARPPLRRFDLLCLMRANCGFKPLLLIECKSMRPNDKAKKQVLDYNYHIKAPFVALAGGNECAFAKLAGSSIPVQPHWHCGLPTHTALLTWL